MIEMKRMLQLYLSQKNATSHFSHGDSTQPEDAGGYDDGVDPTPFS